MCHANVIVLITPKYQDALPNGRTGRSAKDAVCKMLALYGFFTGGDWGGQ